MTEQNTEEDVDINVVVELFPESSRRKVLRQIGLGISPAVILEVEMEEDESLVFKITGSLVEDTKELLDLIEGFRDCLKQAIDEGLETETDDADD